MGLAQMQKCGTTVAGQGISESKIFPEKVALPQVEGVECRLAAWGRAVLVAPFLQENFCSCLHYAERSMKFYPRREESKERTK